jgi:hypothetical protein
MRCFHGKFKPLSALFQYHPALFGLTCFKSGFRAGEALLFNITDDNGPASGRIQSGTTGCFGRMEFFVKNLTAKYVEYMEIFLEVRSGISRGSRSSCLGAQGESAEIRK